MSKLHVHFFSAALIAALPLSTASHAQSVQQTASEIVQVELLPGWRTESGSHMMGIRMTLAEGWKTYWRAPGDGGLPTTLEWSASNNLEHAQMRWPRPEVFEVAGMRSIGYSERLTIPVELTPSYDGNIELEARLHFGVCREVCVPAVVDIREVLTGSMRSTDASISAALAAMPIPASAAGVGPAACSIETTANGSRIEVSVQAQIDGQDPAMIVEHAEQDIWIGTTKLKQSDDHWYGSTPLYDGRAEPSDIDFEDIRITLLTSDNAIDIRGCTG